MKFQKPNTPKLDRRCGDPPAPSYPLLGIPRINRQGMVLEMRHGFEVGSTIALGFHLQSTGACPLSNHAAVAQGQPVGTTATQAAGSCFIGVEAIVIESKPGSSASGQPVHLVTVLFSQISRRDKEKLLGYCRSHPGGLRQFPPSPILKGVSPQEYQEKLYREASQHIRLN